MISTFRQARPKDEISAKGHAGDKMLIKVEYSQESDPGNSPVEFTVQVRNWEKRQMNRLRPWPKPKALRLESRREIRHKLLNQFPK